jgi:integrase
VCLAGESGLRVGEIKALRWREDVDMVAKTITVNQQMRRGITGTPKGRTRRTRPRRLLESCSQELRSTARSCLYRTNCRVLPEMCDLVDTRRFPTSRVQTIKRARADLFVWLFAHC